MSNESEGNWEDERTRFGVLAVVMIGIVLIIAVARPLVFGHVIPVILGEGLTSAPRRAELIPPQVTPAAGESTEPESAEEGVVAPAAEPGVMENGAVPADEATEGSEQATEAQPPSSASFTVHVVRTGDTLTSIAEQYSVTVDAIVRANNLASPNRINIGDELTVPLP